MECSICGNPSGPGALCTTHKRVLSTCADLTPEQIRSRRPDHPAMGLVDAFGVTHAVPSVARVGRDPDACDLAILHASISSNHAMLSIADGVITIVDHDSLNGTWVEGARITRQTVETSGAHVRFGAVSFILCPDALDPAGAAPMGRLTVPRGSKSSRIGFAVNGVRWELSVMGDGATITGPAGELALSLMEGRLLALLLSRSQEPDFLPSADLVGEIGFGARAADGDNVRELVRRLRRKVESFGLGDLIESRRNAGYRIARHAALI